MHWLQLFDSWRHCNVPKRYYVRVFANLWWMSGDTRTLQSSNESFNANRSSTAGYIMLGGLCWLTVFYLVIKPLSLLDCNNPKTISQYNISGLKPRWPLLFSTWREYENIQWVPRCLSYTFLHCTKEAKWLIFLRQFWCPLTWSRVINALLYLSSSNYELHP